LAARVEEQASAVNQIGASLEEMNASIKSIAAITGQRNASLQSLRDRAGEGQEQLRRLDALIVRTKTDVESIMKMTGAISDIATRTDLLSMNAAIEAAHAGAAGRGFSIVAKEIRGLSESVTSNVNSIIEALARIQKSIAAVRDLSGENVVTFGAFSQEITGFADSFREIGGATAEASIGTQEIVEASASLTEVSETVRAGAQTIRSGVSSVEGLMTTVRGACEKTALTIERLTGNVKASNSGLDGLTTSIVGMRDDMMGISTMIGRPAASGGADASRLMAQHLQWVIRARLAMDGQLSQEARKLGDHTKCDLGRWMDSEGAAGARSSPRFAELDASHKRLHAIANEIIATASSSPIEENEERFDRLLETSATILGNLPRLLEAE
ncbi:MAG TPA: methyl-accepting chemotaxis protein, partial [Rectinemataceae bacterium]|nr:methyl-accepting chemotaxis protein [Rectinemataceae bacterium]